MRRTECWEEENGVEIERDQNSSTLTQAGKGGADMGGAIEAQIPSSRTFPGSWRRLCHLPQPAGVPASSLRDHRFKSHSPFCFSSVLVCGGLPQLFFVLSGQRYLPPYQRKQPSGLHHL